MAATYRVRLERGDDGWWFASISSVAGCHTQGRSIEQALNRVREALALWVDDAVTATLEPDVVLPHDLRLTLRRTQGLRDRAVEVQELARAALTDSARTLLKRGYSMRDIGRLLGVSHQRVQQLVEEG